MVFDDFYEALSSIRLTFLRTPTAFVYIQAAQLEI